MASALMIKRIKATLFIAAAIIALSTIGWDMYLMSHRPVISLVIPDNSPENWLCQRVFVDSYCVKLTSSDLHLWHILVLLTLFVSVPTILAAGVLHQLRSHTEDEYF